MANNQPRLPSGQAGITNFADEYKSRFMITPTGVVIFIAIFVAIVLALRLIQ